MSPEIAEALHKQTRRLLVIAEKAVVTEVKRELASVAAALAQLAEMLERNSGGSES